MPSFVEKLRLNNLYPSIPIQGRRDIPELLPSQLMPQQDRIQQIYQQPVQNKSFPMSTMAPSGRPGDTNLSNVQYKAPLSDQIATNILGIERDPASAYQKGELANRQADLVLKKQQIESTTEQKKGELENKKLLTQIAADKAKYAGSRVIAEKGKPVKLIGPDGSILATYPEGTLTEEARAGLDETYRQADIRAQGDQTVRNTGIQGGNQLTNTTLQGANATSLEDLKARHARELKEFEESLKPTGNTQVTEVKDKDGKVIGVKTVKTDQTKSKSDPLGIRK